jgi:hypothetical protein
MPLIRMDETGGQIVLHTEGSICATTRELVESAAFERVVVSYLKRLAAHRAPVLADLEVDGADPSQQDRLVDLLRVLAHNPLERIARTSPDSAKLLTHRSALHELAEGLYDFWRSFDRFMVNHFEPGPDSHDQRPYRSFNRTVETLGQLVRDLYRDVVENITATHPRVYRQVPAGADMGVIAVQRACSMPDPYRQLLGGIPFVRHVLMYPPLILDPPSNTRAGQFVEVQDSPVAGLSLEKEHWMCYPAVVGRLVVFVYFEQRFAGLGLALGNLFELADDNQIASGPDAIYLYGVPPQALARFGEAPTVFYEDVAADLLVAAVPFQERFGYFGYVKKMALTLHNLAVMKKGMMPFHGAFARVVLRSGAAATLLVLGDTATGKSETLEALRLLGEEAIGELRVVADDMGSIEIAPEGRLLGYGTEIGAFVRLDDLQRGYAFGQIDRAIIMSPQKVNARVVLPVTTLEEVQRGYPVDFLLYANNYQPLDDEHPIIERFGSVDAALGVFREGAAMSKGTTASTGLVRTYFANPFGPAQRSETHDTIARRTFEAAFAAGVFVGQMRTRLGLPGYETSGPLEAAAVLLELVAQKS